jgi:hypothetical protein
MNLTWEDIVHLCKTADKHQSGHLALAAVESIVQYDKEMREGKRKLPNSWAAAAPHLDGYEKVGLTGI